MRLPVKNSLVLLALTLLAGCGGGRIAPETVSQAAATGPAGDYPVVVGPAFTVDGMTYTPADVMNYDAVGYAGIGRDGGMTVSAAHRTLPLPSYVEVTSIDSGKTILVRVERRGPMAGKDLIALSPGAALQLGLGEQARAAVRVRRMNPIETDRAALRSGMAALARMDTPRSLLAVLQRKLDLQDGIARPAPGAEPKPQPSEAELPPKSEPKGKFFVQLGAFTSMANAEATARKAGGSAVLSGKLWRVRTGPYASEADAKGALAKAKSAGYTDARIQRPN